MSNIKSWQKTFSLFILTFALSANYSAFASNDAQLCSDSGKLLCIPLLVAASVVSGPAQSQSLESKIYSAIKDANFSELKDLLEKYPKYVRPYQLLSWALESYETGKQEEKRLEILTYLLQQKTDFTSPSPKNTKFSNTEYYQLAQQLIDNFYVNSYPKKRKYTLHATSLLMSYGFSFHPQTEDVVGDPRVRYAKIIKRLSPDEKVLEREFYQLLTENPPNQISTAPK